MPGEDAASSVPLDARIEWEYVLESIALVLTVFCCLVSSLLVVDHLRHWKHHRQQMYILSIVFMAPLFAIDSYVGMLELGNSEWVLFVLDSIKECYEAWTIACFLSLMYSYLNITRRQEGQIVVPDGLKGRHLHHTFPFNYFMGEHMVVESNSLHRLEWWAYQFVFIRPVLSLVELATMLTLDENSVFASWLSFIDLIILNISVTMAVYALILFYHAFEHELRPHRPLAQFLCVKGVVFFCFWQGIILEALAYFGIVHKDHWYSVEEVEYAIQCFLVCVEMGVIFSLAHMYAFSARTYKPHYKKDDEPASKDSPTNKPHSH